MSDDLASTASLFEDIATGDRWALRRLWSICLRATAGRAVELAALPEPMRRVLQSAAERSSLAPEHRTSSTCHYSAAARVMEELLVEVVPAATRDGTPSGVTQPPHERQTIRALLASLDRLSPRAATVARLRFFAGRPLAEVATGLAVSPRQAESDWRFARAWLRRELRARSAPRSGHER